jgi:sirohydrochlorin cobaltochelatase
MSTTVLIIPTKSRGMYHLPDLQDFCATLSTFLQEDIGLWMIEEDEWSAVAGENDAFQRLEKMDHHGEPVIAAAPMSAAPFVYRDDGQPDWGTMWKGFCELALYGGPPHRAPEDALQMPGSTPDVVVDDSMIDEIARGILETAGLTATPSPGGWLSVQCDSKRMAAWLSAVIILENVDARSDGDVLFVPGDKGFELKDQVKSIITVVAKANHYWQEHLANESADGISPARAAAKRVLQGEVIARLRSQKAS